MQSQDWNRGGGKAKVGFDPSGRFLPQGVRDFYGRLPWGEQRPFQTFEDTRPMMRDTWQGGMGDAQAGAAGAGARFGQSRGYMEEGLGMYRDMMDDPSKSVAQQQMKAGMEQNLANQIQAQSAGRGGSMAGAQNLASGQAAGLGTAMNQQAAQLRAQEYQAALGGYSGLAGQMAGMDLQQQGQLGQLGLGYGQMGTDWELGIREQMEQEKQNRWERGMGLASRVTEAIGSAASMPSDVNMKQNIVPLRSSSAVMAGDRPDLGMGMEERALSPSAGRARVLQGRRVAHPLLEAEREAAGVPPPSEEQEAALALGSVPAYEYEYKPGAGPPGRRAGVMAQDLQQEPALAGMVVQTPQGLGVDVGKAASTAMAASAEQQREIEELQREKERQDKELRELYAAQKSGAGKAGLGIGALFGGKGK